MIAQSITDLIGNTPLLKISKKVHNLENIELYAKLELFNPWGSVKDRTAWGMLQPYLDELGEKDIIESSSSNTAKALQMIASINGSKLKTITNRIRVQEAKDILTLIGAEIQEIPGKSDCYDPNDPNDPVVYIQKEIAQNKDKYIYSNQYFNDLNRKVHYDTTGKEIVDDIGGVDFLIGGLGTTGSILGVAERIKEDNPDLEVIGVVADKDDHIPGIRNYDEILEVGLFNPDFYKDIVRVSSQDALEGMMNLIRKDGLLAGPTTGASLQGAIDYLQEIDKSLDEPKKALIIACDRVEWYISYIKDRKPEWFGDVSKERWDDNIKQSESTDLEVEKISDWIKQNSPLIVDVRQPISFRISHIPNSINMPYDNLDSMLNTTNPFCINQKILLVCPVGDKSSKIANYLKTKDVQAYSLHGGINAWRDNNLPLEKES